jgi:hypothetical protein
MNTSAASSSPASALPIRTTSIVTARFSQGSAEVIARRQTSPSFQAIRIWPIGPAWWLGGMISKGSRTSNKAV